MLLLKKKIYKHFYNEILIIIIKITQFESIH